MTLKPDERPPADLYDVLAASGAPYSALSWGGFNLFGDAKSIIEAQRILHSDGILPAIRDELARARKSAWRPIETAPKDGTPIIVCGDGKEYHPRSCWWSWAFECWVVREDIDAGKATFIQGQYLTHWQPLPEPPQP